MLNEVLNPFIIVITVLLGKNSASQVAHLVKNPPAM